MMVRGKRSFENATNHYFSYCETLQRLREQTNDSNLLAVRYEEMVRDPETKLANVCSYLGMDAPAGYVAACKQILTDLPQPRHQLVRWNVARIERVQQRMASFDFLAGYSFEN